MDIQDFLILLIRPDFIQIMVLSTLVFMQPLRKQRHWIRRMLLLSMTGLLLNVTMVWIVINKGRLLLPIILHYSVPLVISFLCFKLCCETTASDAVYGLGNALAAFHIAFCAVTVLWGETALKELTNIKIPLFAANWTLQLIILGLSWACFSRRFPTNGTYSVSWRYSLLYCGVIVFITMILNVLIREIWVANELVTYTVCLVYAMFCCIFMLALQSEHQHESELQAAMEAERRLRRQAQEQYELSRESIDIINRKCHDLKHHVSALRLMKDPKERENSLREMEKLVMIYDTAAQTGNEVLDTVLTEKGLLCEKNQISWTCMANGALLSFMSPADLYILMGNALDNAIESSQQLEQVERRVVRVSIREEHGAAFIQVENYYDHSITAANGRFETTKDDPVNHGFGLQSIRSIAQRYGGAVDIETEGGRFLLSILIPLPESICSSPKGMAKSP